MTIESDNLYDRMSEYILDDFHEGDITVEDIIAYIYYEKRKLMLIQNISIKVNNKSIVLLNHKWVYEKIQFGSDLRKSLDEYNIDISFNCLYYYNSRQNGKYYIPLNYEAKHQKFFEACEHGNLDEYYEIYGHEDIDSDKGWSPIYDTIDENIDSDAHIAVNCTVHLIDPLTIKCTINTADENEKYINDFIDMFCDLAYYDESINE